jgi:hypothetical protein
MKPSPPTVAPTHVPTVWGGWDEALPPGTSEKISSATHGFSTMSSTCKHRGARARAQRRRRRRPGERRGGVAGRAGAPRCTRGGGPRRPGPPTSCPRRCAQHKTHLTSLRATQDTFDDEDQTLRVNRAGPVAVGHAAVAVEGEGHETPGAACAERAVAPTLHGRGADVLGDVHRERSLRWGGRCPVTRLGGVERREAHRTGGRISGVASWDRQAAVGPRPGVGRSVRCQSGTPGTGARLPRGVPHREELVQVRIELTDHLEQPFTLRPVG